MPFEPSKYQQAIFQAIQKGEHDLVIEAVAGSGKTTTLVEAARLLPPKARALFCAFNKSIATEIGTRLNGSGVEAKTLHSLGNQSVSAYLGRGLRVDTRKPYKLIDRYIQTRHPDMIRSVKADRISLTSDGRLLQETMNAMLDMCRLNLVDPTDRTAVIQMCIHYDIELDDRALDALPTLIEWDEDHARQQREIDFTDMIYLPVKWSLPMPTYDWVFVDEAQDLNKCQLELVLKTRAEGGRMVFVGDSRQAIYGFAGADNRSIQTIIERTQATVLPLSICYRCDASIIRLAQQVVPHIEARPDAPAGTVTILPPDKLADTARPGDMIICRLTAPLITECINFIKRGTPARVEGRDVGKQLTQIVDKVAMREGFVFEDFLQFLAGHRAQQAKLLADKNADDTQIASWHDRCDAIEAVYEGMAPASLDDLKAKIDSLFDEAHPLIKLSTIHRCKGLEADRVFIIAPEKLPLQVTGWQMEQEWNLRYVAVTRAKHEMFIMGSMTPGPHAAATPPQAAPAELPATSDGDAAPQPAAEPPAAAPEPAPAPQPAAKPEPEKAAASWVIKASAPVNLMDTAKPTQPAPAPQDSFSSRPRTGVWHRPTVTPADALDVLERAVKQQSTLPEGVTPAIVLGAVQLLRLVLAEEE